MKTDNLLDADCERVVGFSQQGIGVRGGIAVHFRANDRHTYEWDDGGHT